MNVFEIRGKVDNSNEFLIKELYDKIMEENIPGFCLVTLALKKFSEYGHKIGKLESDNAIRICFERIASCLREDEHVVRIHSSYYNILLKCPPNEEGLRKRASELHFAVRDAMEEKYGKKLFLEMGFYPMIKKGVDFYDAQYYADLCRADTEQKFIETNFNMYYIFFHDQKEEFLKYEEMVEPAIKNGDFKLYLQPKIDLKTGKVNSAEALLRWIDPKLGMIPLSRFLPNLEENGMIRDVDIYLFDKACAFIEKWVNKYGVTIPISFNMSKAYFIGDYFMAEYTEVFEKYNIPKDCIRIELLESIVLNDMAKLKPLVEKIYEYGFTCALDDFGSGFSSFDILTNVELSELKIDRSLFQNSQNMRERVLIKHIIDMAHSLNMIVVAEGIETEEYDTYLKSIGCDFIQGFYYYKPMPAEEFEQLFVLKEK